MTAASPQRLKLLDATWFGRPATIGGVRLNPVSASTFILLDRIGHPLLGGPSTGVPATAEMLLDYLWVQSADYTQVCEALCASDPAGYVRGASVALGMDLGAWALEEAAAALGAAALELAAAATAAADDGEDVPGKATAAPRPPDPIC